MHRSYQNFNYSLERRRSGCCLSRKLLRWILLTLIFILISGLSLAVYAAPTIEVSGNTRTKTNYIIKLTNICLARLQADAALSYDLLGQLELQRCLVNSRLFTSVRVSEFTAEKITLVIRDKWSLLALPSYSRGPAADSTYWGLFFFDFNLAGRGQLLGALFNRQQGAGLDSYGLIYDVPYVDRQGKLGLRLTVLDTSRLQYSSAGNDWVYRVSERFRFIWFELRQRLTTEFSLFYGYAPTALNFRNPSLREPTSSAAPIRYANQEIHSLTFAAEWSNLAQQHYYERGTLFDVTWFQQVSNSAKSPEFAVMADLYVGVPALREQVFQWGAKAGFLNQVQEYHSLRVGGELGARAIPVEGAWAQGYLLTSFDYQIPLLRGNYGYWTIAPFVDFGFLGNVLHRDSQNLGYYAYGIGSYLHLRQVNVPALGLFYGANSAYATNYLNFFAGFRF